MFGDPSAQDGNSGWQQGGPAFFAAFAYAGEREVRDGIEQLALCGVSAAQIAKRTAIKSATVNAALIVAGNGSTRARMDAKDLTLDQAAIFAEFEGTSPAQADPVQKMVDHRKAPNLLLVSVKAAPSPSVHPLLDVQLVRCQHPC